MLALEIFLLLYVTCLALTWWWMHRPKRASLSATQFRAHTERKRYMRKNLLAERLPSSLAAARV